MPVTLEKCLYSCCLKMFSECRINTSLIDFVSLSGGSFPLRPSMPTISQTRTRWVSQCVIPMHINALSIYKITHSFFFFLVHPCDEAPTHPNTLILHSLTYTSPPPPHTHCHLPSVLASIGVCICLKDLLHRKINGELQSRQQRTEGQTNTAISHKS